MEKISIGFSYNKKSILSKVIKTVEGSDFSHVYMRKKSKYGEYVYQASGLSVNFMNIDVFLEHNVIVEEYEFELDDSNRDELISLFIKYAGCSYETSALFKLLFILICGRLGIKVQMSGNKDQFICSELAAMFCKLILNLPLPNNVDFITPLGLHYYIAKSGKRVI